MKETFASTPTPITLDDQKQRHLRYSLGAVKRIKTKWGKTFTEILGHPPEDFLPEVLMEGLVEKEGLTEQILLDELLTGPMIEYAQLQFIEAFFGQQQKRAVVMLLERNQAAISKAIDPPAPEPVTTILQ